MQSEIPWLIFTDWPERLDRACLERLSVEYPAETFQPYVTAYQFKALMTRKMNLLKTVDISAVEFRMFSVFLLSFSLFLFLSGFHLLLFEIIN